MLFPIRYATSVSAAPATSRPTCECTRGCGPSSVVSAQAASASMFTSCSTSVSTLPRPATWRSPTCPWLLSLALPNGTREHQILWWHQQRWTRVQTKSVCPQHPSQSQESQPEWWVPGRIWEGQGSAVKGFSPEELLLLER